MTKARPLRVAYLIASLDLGGSERQMVELARRLPRDRFEVEFLLLTHRGPLAASAEAAGVPIHVLGWTRGRGRFHGVGRALDLVRTIRAIRAGRYDIIDAWLFHAYLVAAITRPLTRVPILVAGRRSLSNFKSEYGRLYRIGDALARRSADAIVANSTQVRDDVSSYEGIDPDRITVIHNGVVIPPPISPTDRSALRSAWGFAPDDVVMGCVANYKHGKGLEALLRATSEVRGEIPALRLVLVGEGPLRPVLERMIDELGLAANVRLHGHAEDARSLYGAFDLVSLASESEGLPNVLLEASATGRAIVATKAGGTADVVVHGATGWLVPIGDHEALTRSIRELAADQTLREALGIAARERAATVFGMDRFVAETATLYERLAAVGTRESAADISSVG